MEREPQQQFAVDFEHVEPIPGFMLEFSDERICVSADAVPGLDGVRDQARREAARIYEENRRLRNEGEFDKVPLDVDALGTVEKVEQIGQEYGKDSPEYLEARDGLVLDYARKTAEACRKNAEEYFEPTVQQYDAETGQVFAKGLSVDSMLISGLSPLAEVEESERRKNDYIFLETEKAIVKRPESDQIGVVHIMPCPDWAIKDLMENPKGAHGGYAPEIEKIMIGYDWFDYEKQEIYHEQIGVSGLYITTEVINKALQELGAVPPDEQLDKTAIHATQGIVEKSSIGNAMDTLKILDQVASEVHGIEIFLGEPLKPGEVKNYEKLYEDSAGRRKEQEGLTRELVAYVEELYEIGADHAPATFMVEKFLQEKLLEITSKNPEQAEIVFDKKTADGFREAQLLREQGRFNEAQALLDDTKKNAPAAGSCGAGSCGLEGVDKNSDEGKDLAKKLKADNGDEIVKDKERACKCGAKSIVYAYSKSKVNKLCGSCGAFESKRTK
jgi:hypothetical protein